MNSTISECRGLTHSILKTRGTLVGIACRHGQFAVTETRAVGRRSTTEHLTGWQSHAECVEHMRKLAA